MAKGWRKTHCKRGHPTPDRYSGYDCKVCTRTFGMFYAARTRAKKRGLPFNITKEYLFTIWPADNCCPIFGMPFQINRRKGPHYDSPTLDRVIPDKGYVKGNIAVISWVANMLKQNCTDPAVFRRLAEYLETQIGLQKQY